MTKPVIFFPIWNFSKSGGHKVIAKLGDLFMEKGYKTKFLLYYKSEKIYYETNAEIIYVGITGKPKEKKEFNTATLSTRKRLIDMILRFLALTMGLRRLSRRNDVAIATYNLTAFSVAASAIKKKLYYIQAYEVMDEEKRGIFSRLLRQVTKRSYKLDLVRIVNAELYKTYREIQAKYVIPPGMDLSVYHPKQKYWNEKDEITVGCIGRLEEWKGSQDVADAIEILYKNEYPVKFLVAFYPVQCSKFELIKPDGHYKLSEFYRSVDILVAPGKIQLGAVHYPVIEAMACGTPVITTGYYPADESNSFIVPISRPDIIAEKIMFIANDYENAKKKAQKALNDVQNFEWNRVINRFINIIEEIGEKYDENSAK